MPIYETLFGMKTKVLRSASALPGTRNDIQASLGITAKKERRGMPRLYVKLC
jgi:hypothetical protein